MNGIYGDRTSLWSNLNIPVIFKKNPDSFDYKYGKIVDHEPGSNKVLVRDEFNGKVEQLPVKDCLNVQKFVNKTQKQIDKAAEQIAVQSAEINELEKENFVLRQENKQLKQESGKSLNLVV